MFHMIPLSVFPFPSAPCHKRVVSYSIIAFCCRSFNLSIAALPWGRFSFVQPLSLLRRQGRVAAPSVCFAVACILLAAAPTAPPCFRRWRRSSPLPLVGEPLAKRPSFTKCQGLPSVGATATTVAGPTAASCGCWEPQPGHRVRRESYRLLYSCRGAIHPSSVSLTSTNKKSRSALLQALRLSFTSAVEAKITSPCLRLQQRSRQNASPGPRP